MNKSIPIPTAASFLVTEDCNLFCKYCFVATAGALCKNKKMTKAVAKQALDYLCNNAVLSKKNYFNVLLFGGEPLLNVDTIEYIFEYGLELGEKNNCKFTASIITNGTIMTDRIQKLFVKYKEKVDLNCQLSIDGKKESQDLYRVTKSGKGSFDMIAKNIPVFKSIFSDCPERLTVHGCINKQTMSKLFENYKFFRDEWGFKRIWFMPIHDEEWSESDVKEYEKQLGLIYENIISVVKSDNSLKEIDNYSPLDRCFNTEQFPSHPCGAGRDFITVTANGDIYPCHQFYFDDPTKTSQIGDVWHGIDDMKRKVFLDYSHLDLCTGCDCNNCYRCVAENFYINGSMLSQIKGIRCQLSKVERKFQLKLKKELQEMGLFDASKNNKNYQQGNNPDNPDCLCDSRGESTEIPIEPCREESDIKEALKILLQKVDYIESVQEVILKKFLK